MINNDGVGPEGKRQRKQAYLEVWRPTENLHQSSSSLPFLASPSVAVMGMNACTQVSKSTVAASFRFPRKALCKSCSWLMPVMGVQEVYTNEGGGGLGLSYFFGIHQTRKIRPGRLFL